MANYIMELRKFVGHRPLIINSAGVILIDSNERVLLEHRTDNDAWCIPGGCAELGEEIQQTAIREVFEETGLVLDELKLFNIYSGNNQHYTYPNGDEAYFINIIFLCKKFHGDLKIDKNESSEIKFFDIDKLPSKKLHLINLY